MRRIACGYLCLDIYSQRDHVALGGECANFAVATAQAGQAISLCARLGEDAVGQAMHAALARHGVTCATPPRADLETAYCVVLIQGRERSFPHGTAAAYKTHPFTLDELSLDGGPATVHLDFSSLSLLPALRARPEVLVSADLAQREPASLTTMAHVSFLSLRAEQHADKVARELEGRVMDDVLVLTQGPRGAFALAGGNLLHQPAHAVRVVDSTGAGDAFQAGFMLEYAVSRDIQAAMETGAAWGARACERLGASMATISLPDDVCRERLAFARSLPGV